MQHISAEPHERHYVFHRKDVTVRVIALLEQCEGIYYVDRQQNVLMSPELGCKTFDGCYISSPTVGSLLAIYHVEKSSFWRC